MRFVIVILFWSLGLTCVAQAHELTPTYPKLKQSVYDSILTTTMVIFNRRADVNYYQIEVWDADWNKVPFASAEKIIKMNYLERKRLEIYFKDRDASRIKYICTRSKLLKGGGQSVVASNICSKVK